MYLYVFDACQNIRNEGPKQDRSKDESVYFHQICYFLVQVFEEGQQFVGQFSIYLSKNYNSIQLMTLRSKIQKNNTLPQASIYLLITLLLTLISQTNCERVISHITEENFAMFFHVSFEEQKQLLVTPAIPTKVYFKPTNPYQAFFIFFYNPQVYESMQSRQLYHEFYKEYHIKLIDLLRKRGAQTFTDYEYGVSNSVQIAEIDCEESDKICKFFNVSIFPTFIYLTGGNEDDDMSKVQREVYEYTSWISIQEMLYFTMKAYSHKMIDLSRIKPVKMKPQSPQVIRRRYIKALLLKNQTKLTAGAGVFTLLIAFSVYKITMRYKKAQLNRKQQFSKTQNKQQVQTSPEQDSKPTLKEFEARKKKKH